MTNLILNLTLTFLIAIGSTRADPMGWFSQMLSTQQPRPMFDGNNGRDLTAGLVSPSFQGEPSAFLAQQAHSQGNQMPTGFSMVSQPMQHVSRDNVVSTGCSTNPCQNSGTCVAENNGGFSCRCPWGFSGLRCEIGMTDCSSSPCPPNKVCKPRFNGGFDCLCPANRVGINCEIHNDLCERNPCLNGGVCTAVIGGSFKCECAKPWSGVNCESMFQNPCDDNTLRMTEVKQFKNPWDRHGFLICTDKERFHEMKCSVGTYFNEDLSHCVPEGYEPPKCPEGYCLNDGHCLIDENNLLKCSCRNGFSGDRCGVNIDECAIEGNAACSGGKCVDQVDGYYCMCPSGGIGLNCQQTIRNPCTVENIQVGNNFFELPSIDANVYIQCTSMLQFEVRKCPDNLHWHQEEQTCSLERAPLKAGICMTFPCKNGGECVDSSASSAGFSCVCKPGYTGLMCEQMIDFCLSQPCKNGGKCLPYAGGYTCICKDNVIDDCCCNDISNPCPSRNKIIPGVNNYFEHKFKERYIHCDFDGRAFVRACAPGTVWNQAVLTCTPERFLLNLTSRLDGASQSYGGYGNSYSAPQSSYGGYQTPSVAVPVNVAPVQTPSYAAIQQPQVVVNQPTSNYGGYQQVVDVPKITETSTQGYGGYQSVVNNIPTISQTVPSVNNYGQQQQIVDTPVQTVSQPSSYSSYSQQEPSSLQSSPSSFKSFSFPNSISSIQSSLSSLPSTISSVASSLPSSISSSLPSSITNFPSSLSSSIPSLFSSNTGSMPSNSMSQTQGRQFQAGQMGLGQNFDQMQSQQMSPSMTPMTLQSSQNGFQPVQQFMPQGFNSEQQMNNFQQPANFMRNVPIGEKSVNLVRRKTHKLH